MGTFLRKILVKIGKPLFYTTFLIIITFYVLSNYIKRVALLLFLIIFIAVASLTLFWTIVLQDLPSAEALSRKGNTVSTKIYDRNGALLYTIYKDKNKTPVTLDNIPTHVRLATLAAEDAEFYNHPGFSLRGIVRAIIKNIKEKRLTGGSTITQQLVKNTLLTSEKTLLRKIREIVLAIKVESKFSKNQILEMYLNEAPYGGTAYGIAEAARLYFDKNVKDLNLAEAALLVGLPKSPTRLSPFGSDPELSLKRQKEVLDLMTTNSFITKDQSEEAKTQKLKFSKNEIQIKSPHFVMYVRQLLVDKYGEEYVQAGGLSVTTTLDYSIQKMAEKVVAEEIKKLNKLKVTNGAVLVLDTKTGKILAMVGSKDYFDLEADGNVNVTVRPRPPGSAIKVVNYAYALSNDYTPATLLKDTPIAFNVPGQPLYSPKNYDAKYRGNLSLRSALAESRNVPAVKVLATYGVTKMVSLGKIMGINSWSEPSNYGLSLTLGGGDVKLIELARVYATIANYGKKPKIISVRKITDKNGKVLHLKNCPENCRGESVLDPRVAFMLIDILKDNKARTPAFGSRSALVVPGHDEVAVKTGTSNDLRDNLTIGFNQDYLVAAWVGNNDNSPMARVASGVTGAAPIWNKIMSTLLANTNNHPWPVPNGLVQIPICTLTGTLPCQGCPTRTEWFLKENQPTKHCKLSTPQPSPS